MDRSLYLARLREARKAGRITPAFYLVGLELLRFANRSGTCWPSLLKLADGTGLSVRTVSRAIVALREIGALMWRHRPGATWNRAASNVYALVVPFKEKLGIRSMASLSNSLLPQLTGRALEAALARLGAAMGVPTGDVMPWLPLPSLEAVR